MKSLGVFLIFASIFLSLDGCVFSSVPENDAGFSRVAKVDDLAGCYANLGEVGQDSYGVRYLSHVIWPNVKIDHSSIDIIRVVSLSGKRLKVSAESEGGKMYEAEFTEGDDFFLKNGEICILNKFTGGADLFIGVGHRSVMLGLDERGDGKLKESDWFVGVLFLVIPFAGNENVSIRFRRLTPSCK